MRLPELSRRLLVSRPTHLALAAFACLHGVAHAVPIDVRRPCGKLRWGKTVKYSKAVRVSGHSVTVVGDFRADDGRRSFGRGLFSDRLGLPSEIDASYKNFGARVSGAA